LEAIHYNRAKPNSLDFFNAMAKNPETFGERVSQILKNDHGEDYWLKLIKMNGRAWLKIIAESGDEKKDFFENRLDELHVPTILIHGQQDPRTEPDELTAIQKLLPQVKINLIAGAGHSPHSNE